MRQYFALGVYCTDRSMTFCSRAAGDGSNPSSDCIIQLESITPASESTGAVAVLCGSGANPPDGDNFGTSEWARLLERAAKSPVARRGVLSSMFQAMNYSNSAAGRGPWSHFDFDRFDVDEAQAAIGAALDSPTSLAHASKKVVMAMPGHETEIYEEAVVQRLGRRPGELKRGHVLAQTPIGSDPGDGGIFIEEGVNAGRRDRPSNGACAYCGSANGVCRVPPEVLLQAGVPEGAYAICRVLSGVLRLRTGALGAGPQEGMCRWEEKGCEEVSRVVSTGSAYQRVCCRFTHLVAVHRFCLVCIVYKDSLMRITF